MIEWTVEIDPYEVMDSLDEEEIRAYLGEDNTRSVSLTKNQWLFIYKLVDQSDLALYEKREIIDKIINVI